MSRTAIMTAVARALHRDEPPPWVFDDELAGRLAGDEGAAIRAELVASMPTDNLLSFTRWVCIRARYPEDLVERGATDGAVTQYIILGAGLDTFAYRRRDLSSRVRVFEVDHPASQAWKRARLDAARVPIPDNVVYVPVDFEYQRLGDALHDAAVDYARPTIVSWIGVTMYLTASAIDVTLDAVAELGDKSRLVLTYNQPPEALTGSGGRTEGVLSRVAAGMGEPFVSLYRPHEIEALVRAHGYTGIEHFGPEEALATYFSHRPDVRLGGAQRILAATVPTTRAAG